MPRLPKWLFMFLLPIVFMGGCTASLRIVWRWLEPGHIHPVQDKDLDEFPVLVRDRLGKYSVDSLGKISMDNTIVTNNFDSSAINRDLNRSIGGSGDHTYFQIVSQTPEATSISLEFPTLHDSKLQGWYDIRQGKVFPTKEMLYGPGFAFLVMPWSFAAGLVAAILFWLIFRPRRSVAQE
ncbi:MAG TPA: hypothetical protein VHU84_18885 [Lacipirellulaceae bacterium]|jgi:hypothetical protein|nr:hypothetical protein [Lacipirellulaceae bacterium]